MPDRDSPAIGRQCPSCGRRVPRTVATCRCGAKLTAADALYAEEAAPGSRRAWPTFVVLAVALAAVGYYSLFYNVPHPFERPSAPGSADPGPDTSPHRATPDAATPAPAATPPAAAPAAAAPATGRQVSAEQAAWNAAAVSGAAPAAGAAGPPAAAAALPPPGYTPDANQPLEVMVDRAMPSIVLVETTSGRGSAFFVQHDTLITNVHVVQQDAYVTLRRMDGSNIQARVQTRAPAFDIAVLKVATPSPSQPFLPMGSVASLKPGQEVVVIGSALGTLQNSVSRGIVSGVRNSRGVTLVQSDAAANPGNSGGPMLDRSGRVVGILTAGFRDAQGVNFAVSIDHARDILEGRQTNLGSGGTGLADIKPAGQDAAESDRRAAQGEQQFRQRIASVAEAATQVDSAWQTFRSQCYKDRIPGIYDREWFAYYAPGGIPATAGSGCPSYYQSLTTELNRVRDYMRQTMQEARRANVLPGTIRDELRAKRLSFDGWDR